MKELDLEIYNNKMLVQIHFHLASLTYYNKNAAGAEESLIEDWDFKAILNDDFESKILSSNTITLLSDFRHEWLEYKCGVDFAGDTLFMFFDENWNKIVQRNLIPALVSIEYDFNLHGIEYVPYSNYFDLNAKPTNEAILERGITLYRLLLQNKIIAKQYMS